MTRFFIPFLLALLVHGIISMIPLEQRQLQHPKAGGESSIVVDIKHLVVAEVQQQKESKPRETKSPLIPKPPHIETTQAKDSPSLPQLPAPSTIQIKSEKRKLVQKKPTPITAPTPTLQTKPFSKEQNRANKRSVTSNVSPNREGPTPPHTAIKAKPLYQQNPKPPYPPLARRRNWQGTVLLLATVNYQGLCENVKIQKGSGYPILDKAAKRTVKQWKFTPGQINGQPALMQVLVPIHFILE